MYFRYFVIISPGNRVWPFIWTNKDALCQVWLVLENYLPLEKDVALHLNKLDPLHQRMLCVKFSWNWLSGSGEEDENVKSYNDNNNHDRQILIRKADLNLQLRWAKKKLEILQDNQFDVETQIVNISFKDSPKWQFMKAYQERELSRSLDCSFW